jgi:hypothetical protein
MSRFKDIKTLIDRKGKRYYMNTVLPPIPLHQSDIYIITTMGDRLDNLSFEFYNTTEHWWVIAAANPNKIRKDSYYVQPGIQIRIPVNPGSYIDSFNDFNNENR